MRESEESKMPPKVFGLRNGIADLSQMRLTTREKRLMRIKIKHSTCDR